MFKTRRLVCESLESRTLLSVSPIGAKVVAPTPVAAISSMAKLTANDLTMFSNYGRAVAVNGNMVAVGMVGGMGTKGAVYVYTASAGGWSQIAKLTDYNPTDASCSDGFGCSVAFSGNTIVVGAPQGGNHCQGAVYVYTQPVSGWSNMAQTAKLSASNGLYNDCFGISVAISGNTVVTGAQYANSNGNYEGGAAYVFTAPTSGWSDMTETTEITAGGAFDDFGSAVAISGNTLVVGATGGGATGNSNAAYVFSSSASGWSQTAKLTVPVGQSHSYFGQALAISGGTIAVGDTGADNGAAYANGAVYVFASSTKGWSQVAKLTDGTEAPNPNAGPAFSSHVFGDSVAISGSVIAADNCLFLVPTTAKAGLTAPAVAMSMPTKQINPFSGGGNYALGFSGDTLVLANGSGAYTYGVASVTAAAAKSAADAAAAAAAASAAQAAAVAKAASDAAAAADVVAVTAAAKATSAKATANTAASAAAKAASDKAMSTAAALAAAAKSAAATAKAAQAASDAAAKAAALTTATTAAAKAATAAAKAATKAALSAATTANATALAASKAAADAAKAAVAVTNATASTLAAATAAAAKADAVAATAAAVAKSASDAAAAAAATATAAKAAAAAAKAAAAAAVTPVSPSVQAKATDKVMASYANAH